MGLGLSGLRLGLGATLRGSTVIPSAVRAIAAIKSATFFTNADAADLTAAAAWIAANPSYTNPEFFRRFPEWPLYSDVGGTTPALEGDTVAFAPNLIEQTFLRAGGDAALTDVWDKARRLQLGRDAQLVINLVGNSWVEGPYWVPAFAKQLQDAYGIAGLGWVGFQYFGSTAPTYWINPGTQPAGKTQGSSRPDLIAEPVLNGTWAGENGAGGIAAPSIGGIVGSDSGSGYVQFIMPAGHDSATLYYFGDGTGVVKHSWDGGSTWESNTSLSTVGPASVALANCPATQATLRIHVVSGNVSLAGVYLESSASGVRVNALGASGSNTSQWAAVNLTTWAAQVASLGGDVTITNSGVNDQSGSTLPATAASNISAMFTALEAGDTAALLATQQPAVAGDDAKTHQMAEYATALSAAMTSGGWSYLDLQPHFGASVDDYVNTLLDGSGGHPSAAGGVVIKNALLATFAPNVTAPPEMYAEQATEADRPTLVTGLGPELLTNGGFDVDANWGKGAGWGIAAGIATHTGTTAGNLTPDYSGSLEVGKQYRVAWEQSADFVAVTNYTTTLSNTDSPGSKFVDFTAGFPQLWWRSNVDGGTIDNASLREVSTDYGNSLINGHFDLTYPAEVAGAELLTNGGFDTDTWWSKGTGWGIADGIATHAGTTASNLTAANALTVSQKYRVGWTQNATFVAVSNWVTTLSNTDTPGAKSLDFTAGYTNPLVFRSNVDGATVDDVTLKELLTSADYTHSVRSVGGTWAHATLASQSGTQALPEADCNQLMVATPVLSTEEKATLI